MDFSTIRFGVGALALALCFPAWPGALSVPGVPNFYQVDEHVFRSAQPSPEGWQGLAKLGVKTVIDLRRPDEHSTEEEARAVEAAGMKYVNVPMKGVVAPPPSVIARVLALLNSPDKVLVHCQRGADRTGTVIACYRIAHDGWQRKQALDEAKSLGLRWTQVGLKKFIMSYQPSTASLAPASATAGL